MPGHTLPHHPRAAARRPHTALCAAALATLLVGACGGSAPPEAARAVADGGSPAAPPAEVVPATLRVGLEADLQGFDPLRTRVMGVSTLTVADAVFDTLVSLDDDGNVLPGLALTLTPTEDLTRWTATLREGVTFHDGSPFDAQAVAGHFTRLLDPDNGCACRPFLGPLRAVVAEGPRTVHFELASPWAALPAVLGEPSVISLIGSPPARADGARFDRAPIGTGPYVFDEWRPGERIRLTRYADYWDERHARAVRPRNIEFRILPDQQARLAALRAGDVDLIWTLDGASAARAQDLGLRVWRRRGAGARLLVLNTRRPPLDDVRVRRALAWASDTAAYVEAVSEGGVAPARDPFGPGSPFQCPGTWPGYDPARARALLADYGAPVMLTFSHTATPRGQAAGQIFQQFWQAVGIDVTLQPMEQVALVGSVVGRRYQIGPWRLRDSLDPDPDLFGLFHSASPFNVTGLSSPALDRLLQAGRSTGEQAAREAVYCDIERYLAQQVPYLYLGQNTYFALARADLAGEVTLRGGVLGLRGIQRSADAGAAAGDRSAAAADDVPAPADAAAPDGASR